MSGFPSERDGRPGEPGRGDARREPGAAVAQTVELAACQVFATAEDYRSEATFDALLERTGRRLDAVRARSADGTFAHPCLAVFPEMIGTMLTLVGRWEVVRGATSTNAALFRIAAREPLHLLSAMVAGRRLSPSIGFLLAHAVETERRYRSAFSRFARRHAAWVVAGSALLPENVHGDHADAFAPKDGRVYVTSYALSPEGRLLSTTRKVNLVPEVETGLDLSPGPASAIAPIDTPFGRVATLVCYDGFRVPHTLREPGFTELGGRCDALGVSIVAHPSANPWPWEARYAFGGRLGSERRVDQWRNEGVFSQLAAGTYGSLRWVVTAHLLGGFFDVKFDGRSEILERRPEGVRVVAEARRADASPEAEEVVLARVATRSGRGDTAP